MQIGLEELRNVVIYSIIKYKTLERGILCIVFREIENVFLQIRSENARYYCDNE